MAKKKETEESEEKLKIVIEALKKHKKGTAAPEFKNELTRKLTQDSWNFIELAENYSISQIEEFKKDFFRTYNSYKLVQPLIEKKEKEVQLSYWKKEK